MLNILEKKKTSNEFYSFEKEVMYGSALRRINMIHHHLLQNIILLHVGQYFLLNALNQIDT